jgi:hypothetical protein
MITVEPDFMAYRWVNCVRSDGKSPENALTETSEVPAETFLNQKWRFVLAFNLSIALFHQEQRWTKPLPELCPQ